MSDIFDRDPKILIKEAELLHASNDFIYTFFSSKERIDQYRLDDLDEHTEWKLLQKNNYFIDVTLAQYCFFEKTIITIFNKAVSDDNLSLKLACLANRSFGKLSYPKIPKLLFNNSDAKILDWFSTITTQELQQLFENEKICDDFLEEFLNTEKELWNVLTEQDQLLVIRSLARNPRVCTDYEGFDGFGRYRHEKVFEAIWDLAKIVPVTDYWAIALGFLLEKTNDERRDFESMEVARRWMVEDKCENKDIGKERGGLNYFEMIRVELYKDIFSYYEKPEQVFWDNDDIAYKASGYRKLRFSVDDIQAAYEADKLIAIEYLLENHNIWREESLRSKLKVLCGDADRRYPQDYPEPSKTRQFILKEERLREKFPEWFAESSNDESVDEDEMPLNYRRAQQLIYEVNSIQQDALGPAIYETRNIVRFVEKTIFWCIVVGVISLAIYLY